MLHAEVFWCVDFCRCVRNSKNQSALLATRKYQRGMKYTMSGALDFKLLIMHMTLFLSRKFSRVTLSDCRMPGLFILKRATTLVKTSWDSYEN